MANPCAETFAYICADDYRDWVAEGRTDCQSFFASGLVGSVPSTDSCVSGKAWKVNGFYWDFTRNLGKSSNTPVRGGDGCTDCNTPLQKQMSMYHVVRTGCWTLDNLVDHCNRAGGDAMDALQELWSQWDIDNAEAIIGSVVRGVFLSELALGADGVIYDADDTNTNDDPGFFNYCAMLEGIKFMGCKRSELTGLLVHSDVYANLLKTNQITFMEVDCDNDAQCISRAYFNNKEIYESEDENLILADGRYITVLYRNGAVAWDEMDLGDKALDMDKDICADGGMGSHMWVNRMKGIVHPIGWSNCWTPPTADHFVPSNADLAAAATWCRVYDKRNVGMAFVVSSEIAQ